MQLTDELIEQIYDQGLDLIFDEIRSYEQMIDNVHENSKWHPNPHERFTIAEEGLIHEYAITIEGLMQTAVEKYSLNLQDVERLYNDY